MAFFALLAFQTAFQASLFGPPREDRLEKPVDKRVAFFDNVGRWRRRERGARSGESGDDVLGGLGAALLLESKSSFGSRRRDYCCGGLFACGGGGGSNFAFFSR